MNIHTGVEYSDVHKYVSLYSIKMVNAMLLNPAMWILYLYSIPIFQQIIVFNNDYSDIIRYTLI